MIQRRAKHVQRLWLLEREYLTPNEVRQYFIPDELPASIGSIPIGARAVLNIMRERGRPVCVVQADGKQKRVGVQAATTRDQKTILRAADQSPVVFTAEEWAAYELTVPYARRARLAERSLAKHA